MSFTNNKKFTIVDDTKEVEKYMSVVIVLSDGRIAFTYKENIQIYDYKSKSKDIEIVSAHKQRIQSLLELRHNLLLSGSSDNFIKAWYITKDTYELKATIAGHTNYIYQIIHLTNNRIASCAADKNIIIWMDTEPYSKIETMGKSKYWTMAILQLRDKEILVSNDENCVYFWDLKEYKKINEINDVGCFGQGGMKETSKGKLMVGAPKKGKVVIINTENYQIETCITFDTGSFPNSNQSRNNLIYHQWWDGLFAFIEIEDGNFIIATPKFEIYELDKNYKRKMIREPFTNDLMNFAKIEQFKYVCCVGQKLIIFEYK